MNIIAWMCCSCLCCLHRRQKQQPFQQFGKRTSTSQQMAVAQQAVAGATGHSSRQRSWPQLASCQQQK
jgi:hypothetical protein